jgi:hypothetical protein
MKDSGRCVIRKESSSLPVRAASLPAGFSPAVCRKIAELTRLLLENYKNARQSGDSVWNFAIDIASLRKLGFLDNDLRWLVCKGYVEHARETTLGHEESRTFRRRKGLIFSRRTCFILTQSGVEFAKSVLKVPTPTAEPVMLNGHRPAVSIGEVSFGNGSAAKPAPKMVPRWDRDRQELRVGPYLVKQFKVPALNQERILAAFEEEGWPVRIDDPLPPQQEQDPKRRLHDTINSLNRKQKHRLMRFMGDGTGQGIRWSLITASENVNGNGAVQHG